MSTDPVGLVYTSELLNVCHSVPAFNILTEDDVKHWSEVDLPGLFYEMFSDDEIVTYQLTELTEVNNEEYDQPIKPAISHKEASQSLTTAIKWYEGQDEVEPVSYTHLDVYKRQPQWNPSSELTSGAPASWPSPIRAYTSRCIPVSYTHLDVYKRQFQHTLIS